MGTTYLGNILGPNVELQRAGDYIQWRVAGSGAAWLNLLPLSAIQGLPGVNAVDNDTATAGYISTTGASATKTALAAAGADQVTPLMFGGVGDGLVDDWTACQAAIDAAISIGSRLFIPAGTWRLSKQLVIRDVDGFRMDMAGRFRREDNAVREDVIRLINCTDFRATTIRTDGNAANNGFNGWLVDESKQDVRMDNCQGVWIGLLDSIDPAGDSLYIAGGLTNDTQGVQIDTVSSVSAALTGRNAVSIIKGKNIQIGKILSINTGHPGSVSPAQVAMPSGFDIEPNLATDIVDGVTVGQIIVHGAGSAGLSILSGLHTISNVSIGEVFTNKLAGARTNSLAGLIRGADHVRVGSVQHQGNGNASGWYIEDCDDVTLDLSITDVLGDGLTLGFNGPATNLKVTGAIRETTGHGLVVYNADNGWIDMTIKDQGTSSACLSKNVAGTSSNMRFRGDWAKGTKGAQLVNCAAPNGTPPVGWVLDGVDATGWGSDQRFKGPAGVTTVQSIATRNCPALNFGTAVPTFDGWSRGTIIWNTTPTASGTPGWVCVAAGVPGTWKAMPAVAA